MAPGDRHHAQERRTRGDGFGGLTQYGAPEQLLLPRHDPLLHPHPVRVGDHPEQAAAMQQEQVDAVEEGGQRTVLAQRSHQPRQLHRKVGVAQADTIHHPRLDIVLLHPVRGREVELLGVAQLLLARGRPQRRVGSELRVLLEELGDVRRAAVEPEHVVGAGRAQQVHAVGARQDRLLEQEAGPRPSCGVQVVDNVERVFHGWPPLRAACGGRPDAGRHRRDNGAGGARPGNRPRTARSPRARSDPPRTTGRTSGKRAQPWWPSR